MKRFMFLLIASISFVFAEVQLSELTNESERRCIGSTTNFCKAMKHYKSNGTSSAYDKMIVCGYLGKSGNLNVISKYDGLEVNLSYYSDSALALMTMTKLCPEIARDFQ